MAGADRQVVLRRAGAQIKCGDPERWRELTASTPSRRAATPTEIGNTVAFLAGPLSAYTTGTVLTINGGG
jgi:NAD(P)-dependent dehydrogenase (short-subunit alcohol dehydrogenase family)